jgi:hypothetical protein
MTQLRLPGRSGKMLARFPAFMRAEDGRKTMGRAVVALGTRLDEAERLMTAILRSHRIDVADHELDVLMLASILGLERSDFTIVRKLYDRGFYAVEEEPAPGEHEADRAARGALESYDAYLDEVKESIQRTARLLLEGCGTLWALLEGTAILVGADTLPVERMEHPDAGVRRGGFIHRAPIRYRTIQDDVVVSEEGFVYVVENPVVSKSSEDRERRQREWFRVERGGFFDGPVAVKITGIEGRTAKPMMVTKATHEGIAFNGTLADGEELIFALDGRAYLNGAEVTDRCAHFKGALYDDAAFDGDEMRDGRVVVTPPGGIDRNRPRLAPLVPADELPVVKLLLGESDWRFSIEEGAFDASSFGEAVFALPADPVELAALPPSGRVQLAWRQHTPFAVKVLIPTELKVLESELLDGNDLRVLVDAGLERVRAAGIDLEVDYFDEEWVLNQSLLRDLDAVEGEGLFFSGTNLGGPS